MPPVLLLWMALGSFALAGVIGAALLYAHLHRIRVPILAATPHGAFAGAGLVLLLVGTIMGWSRDEGVGPWPTIALIALLAAATMGVTMFHLHARAGIVPPWLAFAHAAAALTGVVILFLAMVFRTPPSKPVPLSPTEVVYPDEPVRPAEPALPAETPELDPSIDPASGPSPTPTPPAPAPAEAPPSSPTAGAPRRPRAGSPPRTSRRTPA